MRTVMIALVLVLIAACGPVTDSDPTSEVDVSLRDACLEINELDSDPSAGLSQQTIDRIRTIASRAPEDLGEMLTRLADLSEDARSAEESGVDVSASEGGQMLGDALMLAGAISYECEQAGVSGAADVQSSGPRPRDPSSSLASPYPPDPDRISAASPPEGEFDSVATSGWGLVDVEALHTCGVRTDRRIVCWGNSEFVSAAPQEGEFLSVSNGTTWSCGVRTNQAIACWGLVEVPPPPVGSFRSVSVGPMHACGIRINGEVTCWGADNWGATSPPEGKFEDVASGVTHSCGIREDRSLVCWGDDQDGRASPPVGEFLSVSGRTTFTCAIRTDSSAVCWGGAHSDTISPPDIKFQSISAGTELACGIEIDGTVSCWGSDVNGKASVPPGEEFRSVSAGSKYACGVRVDRRVVCW